ncbi:MAG: sensor histidine kinase [Leptolyngbyaceae cyanobacterium CSU_1_3]|nr:sensor histidine kinase [Leptolyngbyaceae cyanobacterium CSU_1_3]
MTNREVALQIAALRERLAELRDRIQFDPVANTNLQTDLQTHVVEELQTALEVLEIAQGKIIQTDPRSKEATLQLSQTLAQASLPGGEVFLREIHHRVKNNLQLVSSLLDLQVMQTDDPIVRELLQNNQSRISLIALLHESLSESPNLMEVNFSEYVHSLAITVFRVYITDLESIELRFEILPQVLVHPDKVIPAGLILNELISNALKYGFRETSTGEMVISLAVASAREIALAVTNRGDRISPGFDPNPTDSLGLQLVNSLVRQIGGRLEVEANDRTTFTVIFDPLSGAG